MFGSLGSSGSLGMGVMMSLQDDFSGTAQTIENSMKRLEGATDAMTTKVTKALSYMKKGMMTAGIGLALLVPLGMAVDKAAEMSDQMADVRKTTGMLVADVVDYRNQLMNIDTRTSTQDLLEITKIGGQLGVAKEEIFGFTQSVDMATVALADEFSGGVEEVAKSLGTLKNLFAETKNMNYGEAMTKIGSAINSLGAIGQATGPNIANFTNRIGQLGNLGPAINEALALGATLQEVGIEGQVGAGGLTVLITEVTELTKQHNRLKDFATQMNITQLEAKNLFNTSRGDFIIKLAKSFEGLAPYEIGNRLKNLGLSGSEVQRVFGSLANSTDLYQERLRVVNEQLQIGTSLQDEFNIKNATPGAILDKMSKKWSDLTVLIGEAAMPVFMSLYKAFSSVMQVMKNFVQSSAGQFVIKFLAIAGVIITAVGVVMMLKGAFVAVAAMLPVVGAAIWGALAPLLPILLPIVGLVWGLVRSWNSFMDVLEGKSKPAEGLLGFFQRIGAAMWTVKQVWDSWNGQTFDLGGREAELQSMGILDQMLSLATWVIRLKELFKGFADGIKDNFGFVLEMFSAMKRDISSLLDNLGVNLGKLGIKLDWIRMIGKAVAYIIMGPIIAAVAVLRVAVTAFSIVLAGVGAIFYGIFDAAKWALTSIMELFTSFNLLDTIADWWGGLVDTGKIIVNGIFEGIKAGWDMITSWITEKLNILSSWNPFGSNDPVVQPAIAPAGGGIGARVNKKVDEVMGMRSTATTNHYQHNYKTVSAAQQSASVVLELNGEKLGSALIDFQNRSDSEY